MNKFTVSGKWIMPVWLVVLACLILSCGDRKKDIEPEIPEASFTYQAGKEGEIKFTNSSVNATKFVWKFGNDSTSQEQNPTFNFGKNGSYLVTLVAYNGLLADSIQQTVTISGVASKVFICGSGGIGTLLNAKTGEKIWDYKSGGSILSSPTYYENKLFISTTVYMQPGKMIALHYTTGKPLWEYKTSGHNVSSPIVQDNKLVFISGSEAGVQNKSILYCVNATTGKLIWESNFDGYTDSSPAIDKGLIYFISGRGLEIVDLLTGKILTAPAGARNLRPAGTKGLNYYYSSPAIGNNGICYYYKNGDCFMYDTRKKTESSLDLPTYGSSAPAYQNSTILVNNRRVLYAYETSALNPRWIYFFEKDAVWYDSPVFGDDMVYTVRDEELYAIDAFKNGPAIKKWSVKRDFHSSPNYYDDIVYVASFDELYAIEAKTGKILWKAASNIPDDGLGQIPSPLIITEKGEAIHSSVSGARN